MFFARKKPAVIPFDPKTQSALLRISICTGEKTLQFQNNLTGNREEIACIHSDAEYQQLLRQYGLTDEQVKKYY